MYSESAWYLKICKVNLCIIAPKHVLLLTIFSYKKNEILIKYNSKYKLLKEINAFENYLENIKLTSQISKYPSLN